MTSIMISILNNNKNNDDVSDQKYFSAITATITFTTATI